MPNKEVWPFLCQKVLLWMLRLWFTTVSPQDPYYLSSPSCIVTIILFYFLLSWLFGGFLFGWFFGVWFFFFLYVEKSSSL